MWYEINVSLNGVHYFATAERSLTMQKEAVKMLEHFRAVFPESEGYKCKLSHWKTVGETIEV